jgi:capsular polysaccharide biosynthesis protein
VKLQELAEPPPDLNTGRPLFVAEFAPGKVIGDVSLVATADDLVAGDVQGLTGVTDPAEHWRLQRWRYRPRVELSGRAVVLAAPAGANYYHWMLESLPRLQLLEWAGHETGEFDRFLLNEAHHRFHLESLDLLKIPAGKRQWCSRGKVYQCERLVLPFMPTHRKGFPAWVGNFLRKRLLPAAAPMAPGQRLFISRRGARRRKLLNEAAIETELGRAGFKVVCLEDMSLAEQVGLFAAASLIVAIHGAALTNLVFAAPGTPVIELVAPTFINHCYQRVAGTMGLRYQEIVGQLKGRPRKREAEDDLWIEPKELKKALEKAGA